jgi:hypothetical protein
LQLRHLPRLTIFIIYKTLIPPVLLYGIETWVWTKREENQQSNLNPLLVGTKMSKNLNKNAFNETNKTDIDFVAYRASIYECPLSSPYEEQALLEPSTPGGSGINELGMLSGAVALVAVAVLQHKASSR